jgi:hypothetical protein
MSRGAAHASHQPQLAALSHGAIRIASVCAKGESRLAITATVQSSPERNRACGDRAPQAWLIAGAEKPRIVGNHGQRPATI